MTKLIISVSVTLFLQAVVYYTESLKSTDIQIQQGSCLALKCLRVSTTKYINSQQTLFVKLENIKCVCLRVCQATESVDYIADLWKSTDEDLRSAAKETVLSFGTNIIILYGVVYSLCHHICIKRSFCASAGKKGYLAFQRMDQLYTEMQEEAYQNQETEITFL